MIKTSIKLSLLALVFAIAACSSVDRTTASSQEYGHSIPSPLEVRNN